MAQSTTPLKRLASKSLVHPIKRMVIVFRSKVKQEGAGFFRYSWHTLENNKYSLVFANKADFFELTHKQGMLVNRAIKS